MATEEQSRGEGSTRTRVLTIECCPACGSFSQEWERKEAVLDENGRELLKPHCWFRCSSCLREWTQLCDYDLVGYCGETRLKSSHEDRPLVAPGEQCQPQAVKTAIECCPTCGSFRQEWQSRGPILDSKGRVLLDACHRVTCEACSQSWTRLIDGDMVGFWGSDEGMTCRKCNYGDGISWHSFTTSRVDRDGQVVIPPHTDYTCLICGSVWTELKDAGG